MPQSGSPFAGPSTPKSAHALSPFGKNSQNAATLLGKGQPSKKQPPSNSQSPRSSPGPKASVAGSSSPYSQRIASLAAAAAPPESPLLPREAETTFHRKLRTLLQQYATQAETWEETATFDGLKWAKMAVDCWSDLEAARGLGNKESGNASLSRRANDAQALVLTGEGAVGFLPPHDPMLGTGGIREKRIAEALAGIEKAEDGLKDVTTRLDKHLAKLTQTSDAIVALLGEASKAKGLEFVFQEPMWGTWTLDCFVSYIQALTPTYALSTGHLALLVPTLVRSKSTSPNLQKSSASGATVTASEGDGKESGDANGIRRKAYEEWIALPYLETEGRGSLAWLESICEVEVGRYRES